MSCLSGGHLWDVSDREGYQWCALCTSYHSLTPEQPAIYMDDYWSNEKGRSTIEEQVHNVDVLEVDGKSKNQFVMDHVPDGRGGSALEIACAPGVLLRHLKGRDYADVEGIEVDSRYVPAISLAAGGDVKITVGKFPECTRGDQMGTKDLIVGLDILEHIEDGRAFLDECYRLLKWRGTLILMLPLVTSGLPDRFFDPREHVWIYSQGFMAGLLEDCGFRFVEFHRWTEGHDLVKATALS